MKRPSNHIVMRAGAWEVLANAEYRGNQQAMKNDILGSRVKLKGKFASFWFFKSNQILLLLERILLHTKPAKLGLQGPMTRVVIKTHGINY